MVEGAKLQCGRRGQHTVLGVPDAVEAAREGEPGGGLLRGRQFDVLPPGLRGEEVKMVPVQHHTEGIWGVYGATRAMCITNC